MTYTGEVKPGGAADTRELSGLTITKVAVDPEMSNNCYLLRCNATGDQVLIDAAAEPGHPAAADRRRRAGHRRDHPPALGPPPRARRRGVRDRSRRSSSATPDADEVTEQTGVSVDRRVGDGDTVAVGDCTLEVIAIAGHTPGSIALLYDDPTGHPHLFTGDSLFPGGPGRTTTPEDFALDRWTTWRPSSSTGCPTSTWFYPGHGNDSTLGAERPHLAEWRERGW